jgi:hypothetical protein
MVVPHNAPPTVFYSPSVLTGAVSVDGGFNIAGLTNQGTVLMTQLGSLSFFSNEDLGGATFIANTGTVSLAPTMGSTTVNVAGSQFTLSGSGIMEMGGAGTARVLGSNLATFTNTSTIRGEGNFLEGFVPLVNSGTIVASGGSLSTRAAGITNTGLLGTLAGGTYSLTGSDGNINNAGGRIHADGGAVFLNNNILVTGGTLSTANGGSITSSVTGAGQTRLADLTNSGNYVGATGNTNISGTINNTGSFTMVANLRADGSVTLSGGGAINLGLASVFHSTGGGTIVNTDNTISGGSSFIGNGNTTIVNGAAATIRATSGTLLITPGPGGLTNSGSITTAGGNFQLSGFGGGSFVNSGGGKIHAVNNTSLQLTLGAVVNGGSLTAAGTGSFSVPNLHTATLADLALDAPLLVNGALKLTGTINGAGTVTLGTNAIVAIINDATIVPTINMGTSSQITAGTSQFSARGLTPQIFNNGLLRGQGQVGLNLIRVTNNGTIRADEGTAGNPALLVLDPNPEGLVNAGIMESRLFGVLQLTGAGGGAFTQTGTALIRALDATSNVRLSGTQISIIGGNFGPGNGSITVDGGTNAIIASLTSDANLVASVNSFLTINNNVNNTGTATMNGGANMVVAGNSTFNSGSGHIVNNGSITIANNGNLDANFIEGTGRTTVQTGGTLRAHALRQGRLDVQSGGFAHLKSAFVGSADASRVGSLTIGASPAFLDLANRIMIVDQSGPAALNAYRAQIVSGYNAGAWNGPGIRSDVAAANVGFGVGYGEAAAIFTAFPASYFGQTVDNTTILFTFTRYGDATLDRVVNLADFNRLASNFGQSNKLWTDGDFTYDGLVNLADFNKLASNFGLAALAHDPTPQDWADLAAAVPEPVLGIASSLAVVLALPRRRRRLR